MVERSPDKTECVSSILASCTTFGCSSGVERRSYKSVVVGSNPTSRKEYKMRWQHREEKLRAKKSRMPKHGKGMMMMYVHALSKKRKLFDEKNNN